MTISCSRVAISRSASGKAAIFSRSAVSPSLDCCSMARSFIAARSSALNEARPRAGVLLRSLTRNAPG